MMNLIKDYKQYFTPDRLAEYMVSIIPDKNVNTIIDLSMGECGLLEEAKKRWENAELFGADIDKSLIRKINEQSPYIKTYQGDSLSENIGEWKEYTDIVNKKGFDLAIANPPFNFFNQELVEISENVQVTMPIEIRFLLRYVDVVKNDGYICIILPYGFLSLDLYKDFRIQILEKVRIVKVIKIFERCFEKIDADTCLILMQKKSENQNTQTQISIEYLDNNYELSNGYLADVNKVSRWDLEYQYLLSQKKSIIKQTVFKQAPFSKYIKHCRRGKTITKHKELLVDKGVRFIHTTDLKNLYISNQKCQYVLKTNDFFCNSELHENDVLIGRVGQGCIGKIGIVTKKYSKMYFSDCLYAIEVENINPYYVTLFLASRFGQMQLKGLAKGSCSKYITREELLNLCIIVPEDSIQDHFGNQYRMLLSKPGRVNKEKLFIDLLNELDEILVKKG